MGIPYPVFRLNRLPMVRLHTISWYDCGPGEWELRKAINAHWTYYCNDRDGGTLYAKGGAVPLKAGRLVLVPGGCRFDTSCTAHLRHLFGYFEVPGLYHHRFDQLHHPLVPAPAADDAILHELLRGAGNAPTPAQALRLAALLANALTQVLPETGQINASEDHALIAPACQLIDERYEQPMSNGELAAACGLSINTFMRHFRTATGTTPTQALRSRRVQAAALALERGVESLDDIARDCGFPNRTYLSRVFQAVIGMAPSTYRKRNRRGQAVE